MAYEIIVESSFSAAHQLRGYKGKCENLHGHNWKVEAIFSSAKLNKIGLVLDFTKAKALLEEVLNEFDHKDLSNITFFKKNNPTSELIAKFVFDKLKKLSKNQARQKEAGQAHLRKVSVWETPTSCASYTD